MAVCRRYHKTNRSHILIVCAIFRTRHGSRDVTGAGSTSSLPLSDPGNTVLWDSKKINPRLHSCLRVTHNV